MDVWCTDKTGTLTEGVVRLMARLTRKGNPPRLYVLRLSQMRTTRPG